MKRQTPNYDWFDFRSPSYSLPNVNLRVDRYRRELEGVRKSSSGSNELLRESQLVELVEGAPWQSYTNLILLLSALSSRFLFFIYLLVLSALSLFHCPRACFSTLSFSIHLPFSVKNMDPIRHFAEPVLVGHTFLENTSGFGLIYILETQCS